ncbi:hypothetical protein BH11MYX2_BH11MYX2_28820 [soil metagenome]
MPPHLAPPEASCTTSAPDRNPLSKRVPPLVQQLLNGVLDTFEKLEVAIVLARSPALTSSVTELTTSIGFPRESVERGISALTALEIVESSGGLVRLVVPPRDLAVYRTLVELYDADRVLIAQAVSEIAMEKIRGMAARTFAEAFLATRKKNDSEGK